MKQAKVPNQAVSPASPGADIVAHLRAKDLRAALGAVAHDVRAHTGAQAASLMCLGDAGMQARTGDWPADALARVAAWERALAEQAKRGATALPEGPLPVSTARGADWTVLAVPLAVGRHTIGLLSACISPADEAQTAQALQDIAPWLGGLLYFAQGRDAANRQIAALGAVLRQTQTWMAEADARAALRTALQVLSELFGAQGSLIASLDDDGNALRCLAAYIPNEALDWSGARLRPGGILHHVCVTGEPVLCAESEKDPRYAPDVEGALVERLQSLIAVPIVAPGGRRAALAIFNRRGEGGFRPSDATLIASVAACVSALLEAARLQQAMAETRQQIEALPRSIRMEIAGTLHQGPIQLLAAVAMGLDHVEHLLSAQPEAVGEEIKSLKALTREATREARLLLFELRPAVLESEGLLGALTAYIQQLPGESIRIRLDHSGPVGDLPMPIAEAAFHAATQGIRHARLHGEATEIGLTITVTEHALALTLEDNGKPHGARRCVRGAEGIGCLASIAEQLKSVGGVCEPQEGSGGQNPAILVRIPLV